MSRRRAVARSPSPGSTASPTCASDSRRNGRSAVPTRSLDEASPGRARISAGRAVLQQPRLVHDGDPVAEMEGLLHVVGDQHDRGAEAPLDGEQVFLRLGADDRVERAERLVHQKERGLRRERPRDADALLLATGQVRAGIRSANSPGSSWNSVSSSSTRASICALSQPSELRHGGDVLRDGAVREKARGPGWRSRCGGEARPRESPWCPGRRSAPRPEVGSIRRLIIRSSVDLPEPEVPTIDRDRARLRRPARRRRRRRARRRRLVRWSISIMRGAPLVRSMTASRITAAANARATIGMAPSRTRSIAVWPMPWKMNVPKPAAPDQCRDGGEAEVLHQHDADAGEDDRETPGAARPAAAAGARGHPHAPGRVDRRRAGTPSSPTTVFATTGSSE